MDVRRLDVTRAFVGDLQLTFGETTYTVDGDFDIDTMIAFAAIEQRIQASESIADLLVHLVDARNLIQTLVNDRHPDAVLPKLSPKQINRVFAWMISGGTNELATAAGEITDALTEGVDLDALVEDGNLGDNVRVGEQPAGIEEGPLVPVSSSDEPSSTSETTTDGDPNGGGESAGVSSGFTSTPLTVA